MSTAAILGGVTSVELQASQSTTEEQNTLIACQNVRNGYKEMDQSTSPEQCSNAQWAGEVRKIEADLDQYPVTLYRAIKHCRTADYYQELEFCGGELWQIWRDFYDIVNI